MTSKRVRHSSRKSCGWLYAVDTVAVSSCARRWQQVIQWRLHYCHSGLIIAVPPPPPPHPPQPTATAPRRPSTLLAAHCGATIIIMIIIMPAGCIAEIPSLFCLLRQRRRSWHVVSGCGGRRLHHCRVKRRRTLLIRHI